MRHPEYTQEELDEMARAQDEWEEEQMEEEEIIGYYCLGCGHDQDHYHHGECDACCAYALEPIYE